VKGHMSQEDGLRMIDENHGVPQKELSERLALSWKIGALVKGFEEERTL